MSLLQLLLPKQFDDIWKNLIVIWNIRKKMVHSVFKPMLFLLNWAEVFCYTTAKDMKRIKCLHIKRRGQFTISLLRALVENNTISIMIPLPLSAFRPPDRVLDVDALVTNYPTTRHMTVSKSVDSFFSANSFCTRAVTSWGKISIRVLHANFLMRLSLMGPLGMSA